MLVKVTQDRKEHWDRYSYITQADTNQPSSHHSSLCLVARQCYHRDWYGKGRFRSQNWTLFYWALNLGIRRHHQSTTTTILGEAKENILKAQNCQKEDCDKGKANPSAYAIGSIVLFKGFLWKNTGCRQNGCQVFESIHHCKKPWKGTIIISSTGYKQCHCKVEGVNGAHLKPY